MDKAIELDPKESKYYNYRATVKTLYMYSIIDKLTNKEIGSFAAAFAYENLKKRADDDANIAKFINYCEDLKGDKSSQEQLRSLGIAW